MKKIKIIDLLIKAAKGEELPKKIKFGGIVWLYVGKDYIDKSLGFNYMDSNKRYLLGKYNFGCLNEEAEVIDELNLYDTVNYCDHEWYVIKIENNEVTLMSKDVIGTCTYSDYNSNDFTKSNCIKLLSSFLAELNLYELKDMKTNYGENKFYISLIRIPTLREIEEMPMSVRKCEDAYWTMTASYGVSEDCIYANVFYVYSTGYLNSSRVADTNGVRPVIKVRKDSL